MKMRIILSAWFSLLLIVFAASCVKEGPEGPAGANGKDGIDGVNGLNGQDGAESCSSCHASGTDLYAKQIQYRNSVHALGGNFERNATSCAICHTHEGFLERLENGGTSTAAAIQDPTPVNCRTCHMIHENFDETDWALRVTGPVDLINGGTVDFGKGNMCINCHQSRPYQIPDMMTDSTAITSSRWGTHHGPQSTLVFGLGGFEVPGSLEYTNSPHKDLLTDGCISCHMATAFGNSGGGHTFSMTYESSGRMVDNIVACTTCHAGAENFNINGAQDNIEALLTELEELLLAKGVLNPNSGLWNTGTYSTELAGAALNYIFIEEDRSKGVHNYEYARALLTNSIESIK
jgi:hypothetical protein